MQITNQSVSDFLESIPQERRQDIEVIMNLFHKLTGKEAKMWGTIIGYGDLHYKYKTGREGDMPLLGLANRKQAITLYLSYTINNYPELEKLGKFTTGKSCLYIKKLSDIDLEVLEELTQKAIKETFSYDFVSDNEA